MGSHKTQTVALRNPERLPVGPSDEARYWAKVDRKGDAECWPWTAGTFHGGYGQFRLQLPGAGGKQKTAIAHRVSWQLAHGPIPAGRTILHNCDNPRCQNPAHLSLGTQADNIRDASAKGRLVGVSRRKLTAEQRAELADLYRSGVLTFVGACARFGVSHPTVARILKEANAGKRRQKVA